MQNANKKGGVVVPICHTSRICKKPQISAKTRCVVNHSYPFCVKPVLRVWVARIQG
jgi:hypothetical protein